MIKLGEKKWRVFILISILVLVIFLFVGFLVFQASQKKEQTLKREVEIEIKSFPKNEIVSGGEITFFIDYQNQSKIPLENVEIDLQYPSEFEFIRASQEPINKYKSFWKIGQLSPQTSKTLEVSGKVLAKEKENLILTAVLRYKPTNFKSFFEKKETFVLKLLPAPIELVSSGPRLIKEAEDFSLKIKVKNLKESLLKDLRFLIEPPVGFSLEKLSPQSIKEGATIWQIEELKGGEEKEFEIFGRLSGEIGQKKDFQIKIGKFDENQQFQIQNSSIHSIEIIQSFLEISQKVNGEKEISADFGDELKFEIVCKNKSNLDLKNLILEEELNSKFINLETIEVENGLIIGQGGLKETRVQWEFDGIKPNEEKIFSFKARLIPVFIPEKETDKNLILELLPKIKGEIKENELSQPIKAEGEKTRVKINSDLGLEAEARFFDEEGNQIGQGPLPPETDKKTIYRIYFKISSGTNDLKDAKVETILFPEVIWQDKTYVSQGNDLEYKKDERRVIWNIGKVLANTGSLSQKIFAYFEIAVIPQTSQVNKLIQFTKETTASAKDEFTEKILEEKKEILDSDLKYDLLGKGKGQVR